MRCGAELLDRNLDLENIYANLYIKSEAELHLQGYILNRFRSTHAGVSYFYMTRRTQKRFGVSLEDASVLVNVLDSIRGSLIWIFFIDQPDGTIRVRLRSRFAAVNDLAGRYRGGGHKQAAGATVYSKREMKKLLREADAILDTYKKANPGAF
jgi:phosphoesterase RecJ-like protein